MLSLKYAIYLFDIFNVSDSKCIFYADDMVIIVSAKSEN